MELGDLVTVVLVGAALWTFLPRRFRLALRSGFGPTVFALVDGVRAVKQPALKCLTFVGYRVLIGRDVSRRTMSSTEENEDADQPAVPPVVITRTAATTPIAINSNEYNNKLSDNARRDFETTARNVAHLYEAGIITNLSKAICKAFGCSVQSASKPDSTYQLALKAVNKHLSKNADMPQYRPLDEKKQPVLDN